MRKMMNRFMTGVDEGGMDPAEGEEPQEGEESGGEPELSELERDQAEYDRLAAKYPDAFRSTAPTPAPARAEEEPPKKEVWDMTADELAEMGAQQGVMLTTAVLDTRDEVNDLLADYDPSVRQAARQIMKGISPKEMAKPGAARIIAGQAIGSVQLSGKAVKTSAPKGRGEDTGSGGGEDIGGEAEFAAKQMGVTFTKAELRAAGIGGRN